MSTLNCKINSITLSEGESFVIPPNATLIGVSDIGNISSECINLDTLEELACYMTIHFQCGDFGSGEPPFEENNNKILGFFLGETYFPFTTPYAAPFIFPIGPNPAVTEALLAEMKQKLPAIIDYNYVYNSTGACPLVTFQVKTLPSIGEQLSFYIGTHDSNLDNQIAYKLAFFPSDSTTIPNTDYGIDDDSKPESLCDES